MMHAFRTSGLPALLSFFVAALSFFVAALSLSAAVLLSGCGKSTDAAQPVHTSAMFPAMPPIAGELESARAVKIAPPSISRMWNYNIKTLVAENKHVNEGELVAAFDDKPVRDRLREKQAELKQARSELEKIQSQEIRTKREDALAIEEKRAEFEKARRRAEILDHSMSRNDREKAAIDFEVANSDLELARELEKLHHKTSALNISLGERKVQRLTAETETLQAEVNKLQVLAPISGLVQYIPNWEGEKPSEGDSVRFGQPILLISDLSQMRVRAQADEVDRSLLAVGATVNVVIDGAQARTLSGQISELGSVVRDRARGDRRRVIDLLVGLEQGETELRPGMTASVTPAAPAAEKLADNKDSESGNSAIAPAAASGAQP